MATNLLPLRPAVVCASANPADLGRRRIVSSPSSSSAASSPKWWSPLFGWSSEPDYVGAAESQPADQDKDRADLESKQARSRFSPGCFTAEKAKQLRMLTSGTSAHHEMYHSAIASRLASDFKNKNNSSISAAADR